MDGFPIKAIAVLSFLLTPPLFILYKKINWLTQHLANINRWVKTELYEHFILKEIYIYIYIHVYL